MPSKCLPQLSTLLLPKKEKDEAGGRKEEREVEVKSAGF